MGSETSRCNRLDKAKAINKEANKTNPTMPARRSRREDKARMSDSK